MENSNTSDHFEGTRGYQTKLCSDLEFKESQSQCIYGTLGSHEGVSLVVFIIVRSLFDNNRHSTL